MDKIFSKNIVGGISVLWIVFIFCLLVLKRDSLIGLELNSIGDFLAGTFAPLGFFWLVAGFYQQGKGLEQNSEALKLQAKELKKTTQALKLQVREMKASVEQQSRLAKAYEDELEQKHFQAKPKLDYTFKLLRECVEEDSIVEDQNIELAIYKEKVIYFKLTIENLGEMARNLNIKSTTHPYIRKEEPKFEHSAVLDINFKIDGQAAVELTEEESRVTFLFEVNYQNVYGTRYKDQLTVLVESVYDFETNQIYLSPTLEKIHAMAF